MWMLKDGKLAGNKKRHCSFKGGVKLDSSECEVILDKTTNGKKSWHEDGRAELRYECHWDNFDVPIIFSLREREKENIWLVKAAGM